ncbi:MAG: asparagine synthase (glutamine-hydrolyzing) [Planctomycetaceae bacterium]|nr:asparagine synthase (glutamine-hydrolyzing) [Planctomycetaceae bacterium]
MCGILGMVAAPGNSVAVDPATLDRMRDCMITRGPDDAGRYIKRNIAFAHRRLAIRDRDGGVQPWIDEQERTVLVYNGEIYNDRPLRQQLESAGHRFQTHCDTEVLARAYQEWGIEVLSRLNGDFAFGLYDFDQEQLLLARDRCGVKPLFFTQVEGTLLFASSIAAILAHPRFSREPNPVALSHFLTTFRLTLGRETMYKGIWQLLPGEYLLFNGEKVRIESYWEYPLQEEGTMRYLDAVDELEELLDLAVSDRLVSDVPVGLFLSGGVDSNTLACLLHRHVGHSMRSECGGSLDPQTEDFDFARKCADYVGFEHSEVKLSAQDYLEDWDYLIDEQHLPLTTPTDVIIYRIAQALKESVGVALGGEGADELLCGYATQHWSAQDYVRSNRLMNKDVNSVYTPTSTSFLESLQRQYGRAQFSSETDHYLALNSLIPSAVKPALLQNSIWQGAMQDQAMIEFYHRQLDQWGDLPTRRKYMLMLHKINLESLLYRLDSATMQASLEARVPYTDVRLLERTFQVPQRYKIDVAHGKKIPHLASAELDQQNYLESKRILRTLADRLMPRELATRKKASFPTSVQSWLAGPWSNWASQKLRQSPFAREVFQPAALAEISAQPQQAGMWLWPMLNLSMWGDKHLM